MSVKKRVENVIDALSEMSMFNMVVFADAATVLEQAMVVANGENKKNAKMFLRPFNTEGNWGLTHAMGGPVYIFTNSDLMKFQGAFEAIYFELGDGSDDAASLAIRDLILKYVEVEAGPDRFSLAQNYPNPFNPTTYIQYNLPTECHVTLTIHNILGQTVATLLDETQDAGYRRVVWNGKSGVGESLPSGIYFYRLTAGSFSSVKKMMMLR